MEQWGLHAVDAAAAAVVHAPGAVRVPDGKVNPVAAAVVAAAVAGGDGDEGVTAAAHCHSAAWRLAGDAARSEQASR